jgi:hypothetical protein
MRTIVMATRTLSPKQIAERTQQHRQAVMQLARLAAKRAVQDQLRAQGVRVSLVLPRDIAEKASAYLAAHPELYRQASERAQRMGYMTGNQSLLLCRTHAQNDGAVKQSRGRNLLRFNRATDLRLREEQI